MSDQSSFFASTSCSTTCIPGPSNSAIKSKKRNDLSLKLKYEVIKTFEKERLGIRKLATMFNCGKTQISCILQNKKRIRELFEGNAADDIYQTRKRARLSKFCDVNDALYQWFCLASTKNIHPSGSILMEKARKIAEKLSIPDFKAFNGWLDRWKKKHNINPLGPIRQKSSYRLVLLRGLAPLRTLLRPLRTLAKLGHFRSTFF